MERLERTIRGTTSAGSALIVVSLMFMVRDIQSTSFFVHALAAISMPAVLFGFARLSHRTGNAPLVTAGLTTAAAWLAGVALIHLDDRRFLLPPEISGSYWLVASALATGEVTMMGSRTRLWLMAPIVLLLQVNLFWALIHSIGVPLFWQPLTVTLLGGIWLLLPVPDRFWQNAYRLGAVVLLIALCAFLLMLPDSNPAAMVMTWVLSAELIALFGVRQKIPAASHVAVWGLAGAWAIAHRAWVGTPATFGLWMTVPAVVAVLFGRFTHHRRKHKKAESFLSAMFSWPAADLAVGLSIVSLLATAANLKLMDHIVLMQTLLALSALWLALGIEYRLPVFVHLALYVAPFPLTMMLISSSLIFTYLPILGMAWQLGGVGLLLIAHGMSRGSALVRAPFFITGYALIGAGLVLADTITLPLHLGIAMLASLVTAALILLDRHPLWDDFAAWVAPPAVRPYANRAIRSAFLLLGAWLAAVWFQIMLGALGLPAERQGLGLVLISSAWFLIGWTLDRIPGVMGWTVHSAGWLIYGVGLLQVFFAPAEAVIAAVFGLGVTAEQLFRQRRRYWLPVALMQIAFVVMQGARLFALPAGSLLGLLVIGILIGALAQRHKTSVRPVVIAGALIALAAVTIFGPGGPQQYVNDIARVVLLAGLSVIVVFREPMWRLGAVPVLWTTWWLVLNGLGIDGLVVQNVPVGVALLIIARIERPGRKLTELAGITLLFYPVVMAHVTGIPSYYEERMAFLAVREVARLSAAASCLGLMVYGVLCRRRRSFVVGAAGAALGVIVATASINVWLIPWQEAFCWSWRRWFWRPDATRRWPA
ncbi:MAG: hypothetical protein IPK19_07815 [Chloroflexi bacterium]|nr:hypothetical protein [Chloroflexota bacterium]